MEVYLKDKTDLHNPTIKCQSSAIQTYNYMRIGNTYYWIVAEVVQPNNWIEWTGQVDAMATCADEIKSTTAFVERSEVGSTLIADSLAPALTDGVPKSIGQASIPGFSNTGVIILTVNNYPAPLQVPVGALVQLYDKLNSQDIIDQLKESIVRLDSVISGAIWLPLSQVPTSSVVLIKAGFVSTGIGGGVVDGDPIKHNVSLGSGAVSLLNSSYYASYTLFLPFVGAVQLSADQVRQGLVVSIAIDPATGAIAYKVLAGDQGVIGTYSGSCGVPIPIGATAYNVGGAVASAAGVISSLASGNLAGAAGSVGALMGSGILSSTSTGGGFGSRAGLANQIIDLQVTQRSAPEAFSNKAKVVGLPTYRTMSLGSISGFVKCINASIEAAHEFDVIDQCNNYLNTGAYIE